MSRLRLVDAHEAELQPYERLGFANTIVEQSERDEAELHIRLCIERKLTLDMLFAKWGALLLTMLGLLATTVLSFRVALLFDMDLTYLLPTFGATVICFGIWLMIENFAEDLGIII